MINSVPFSSTEDKVDYESKLTFMNLFEKLFKDEASKNQEDNNYNSNATNSYLEENNNFKIFNSFLFSIKLENKLNSVLPSDNIDKKSNYFRITLILNILNKFKISFHSNDYEELVLYKIETTELNQICHNIYKLLLDEHGDIIMKDIDTLLYLLTSPYFGKFNFEGLINLVENHNISGSNSHTPSKLKGINNVTTNLNKVTFEVFSKYFKHIINFYLFSEKFEFIFKMLDQDNKGKILTAELVVCIIKITRDVEDSNHLTQSLKRYLDSLNQEANYVKKIDFYIGLLKAINNYLY
jgi:Ca2+-binding EF-hand superfamily protein